MRTTSLLTLPLVLLLVACAEEPAGPTTGGDDDGAQAGVGPTGGGDDGGDGDDGGSGDDGGDDGSDDGSDDGGSGGGAPAEEEEPAVLKDRVVDYGAALRTASLKLLRQLPTLEKIKAVGEADDPQAVYEAEIDAMFDNPRFNQRMVKFWQDTMHQGGSELLNTAPVFAAQLVAEDRPYTELFTASAGNCPTYDGETNTFTPGECNNNVPQAGVLTNPGSMAQFMSNLAFRRIRWVQEVFVCKPMPAQFAEEPIEIDGKDFTSPYPMESIANAPINFRDTSAVVCGNCHGNMNHLAPLFGNFDADGNYQDTIQVMTPTAPDPVVTELSHWLVPGEVTEWRFGVPAANLQELGSAMAADPDVMQCAVTRFWNFTMSKEDVVSDLATVPFEVIEPFYDEFYANGFDVKETLKAMFKSDDFVRF
jgi:hypothetical protein